MKVLMLTWEMAPRITGGLGVACRAIRDSIGEDPSFTILVHQPETSPISPSSSYGAYFGDTDRFHEVRAFEVGAVAACVRTKFDVVYAHDWLTLGAALTIRERFGIPFVAHIHSIEYDRAGGDADPRIVGIERDGLRSADRVIAVSHATKRRIIALLGVDPSRVEVVYNGCVEKPGQRPSPHQYLARPQRVAFIGRLTSQKGPDYFLDAAEKLASKMPELEFVIAGTGDMEERLRSRARAILPGRIRFVGFVSRDAVHTILSDSRVLIVPSRQEPFGLVVAEAALAGTPTVVSLHAGATEVLHHSRTVVPHDAEAIAEQCMRLLTNPVGAANLAQEAWAGATALTWSDAGLRVRRVLEGVGAAALRSDDQSTPDSAIRNPLEI